MCGLGIQPGTERVTVKATTALTLATGKRLELRGTYEDITVALKARTLGAENGQREFIRADGRRVAINIGAIALVEEIAETAQKKHKIGFR